jgi:5-methylcytosine-specific restriction endonuclease McrA
MVRSTASKSTASKSTASKSTTSKSTTSKSTTSHATYGQKSTANKVFNLAKPVAGKDPKLYRQDPYKNVMYKHSHGKSSPGGWDIDHIKPSARGGSDSIRNLQALNTTVNRSKGDTLVKASRHSG